MNLPSERREREMSVKLKPPSRVRPELERALAANREAWARMTPEEQEELLQAQRRSHARQDMD
jgi:hypothetical protein